MRAVPTVSPYPWAELPRVDRDIARREASLRSRWRACRAQSIGRELEALLATSVEVLPQRTTWTERQCPEGGPAPFRCASHDQAPAQREAAMIFWRRLTGERLTVVTESETLSTLVAWLTGGGRRFAVPAVPPLELLEGFGSAIVVELARRLGAPLAADRSAEHGVCGDVTCVTHDALVVISGRSFTVTVEVSSPRSDDCPSHGRERDLGDLPVTLPVVGAWSLGSLGELLGLTEGDVWLPGAGWHIDGTGGGRAALISPNAARGPWVDLAINGRVVLRDDWAEVPEEVSVTEHDHGSQPSPAREESMAGLIADTPVVVRVEVGSATLPARRWVELECGDVLCLEQPIGGAATLRVAGQVVAEGELVNVDGQLGVRIRRLLTSEASK